MNYGPLEVTKRTNDGFGSHFADEHAKSFPISLATIVKKAAGDYGNGFQPHIAIARRSAIFGKRTKPYLAHWPTNMSQWERKQVKRRM